MVSSHSKWRLDDVHTRWTEKYKKLCKESRGTDLFTNVENEVEYYNNLNELDKEEFANFMMKMLYSNDSITINHGITFCGFIRLKSAIPRIKELIQDPDHGLRALESLLKIQNRINYQAGKLDIEEIQYHKSFLSSNIGFPSKFISIELMKLHNAAITHGYRGPSKHKRNGIVPIKPTDYGLLKAYDKLLLQASNDIQIKLQDATKIKVVAHVPSGNRLIGGLYQDEHNKFFVYILGAANYNGEIR